MSPVGRRRDHRGIKERAAPPIEGPSGSDARSRGGVGGRAGGRAGVDTAAAGDERVLAPRAAVDRSRSPADRPRRAADFFGHLRLLAEQLLSSGVSQHLDYRAENLGLPTGRPDPQPGPRPGRPVKAHESWSGAGGHHEVDTDGNGVGGPPRRDDPARGDQFRTDGASRGSSPWRSSHPRSSPPLQGPPPWRDGQPWPGSGPWRGSPPWRDQRPWRGQPPWRGARGRGQFRRPVEGRLVGGVAEALSQRFGIDVVIVRVLFAVACLASGAGAIVYVLG
ncbi:MAG: PspC domain-containing protein, partial [Thermoplasmata archaeon]